MRLHLERDLPIPLHIQLKGQIEYGIMEGRLPAGAQLPSVRNLSAELGIAPMTVVRVYHELKRQGLIDTRAGDCTFVVDLSDANLEQSHTQELSGLLNRAIEDALAKGFSPEEIRSVMALRLGQELNQSLPRQLAVVGNFARVTRLYARDIERILYNIPVAVEPLTITELRQGDQDVWKRIENSELVITVPNRVKEVKSLLDHYDKRVISVAFVLSETARQRIASLPSVALGVIATFPEYLQSMLEGIAACRSIEGAPLSAVLEDEPRVHEVLAQAGAVVYASGSERILDWLPAGVETAEYLHTPEPTSVERLRPLLV